MTSALEAARAYVRAGYFVYPVELTATEGKKNDPDFPGHWSSSVGTELEADKLFTNWPGGVAIDTGKSGIVVIDIDTSRGKDGLRNLAEAGIALPATPMSVTTWSGGKHGFYRQPDKQVGSSQNRPVKDVDTRGIGGVVFGWPTEVTENGRPVGRYELNSRLVPVCELPVLAESYAARVRAPEKAVETRKPLPGVLYPTTVRDDQRRVLEGYLEDDLRTIASAGDGERNEALGRAVLLLADRCSKLGYGQIAFRDLVLDAYHESGGSDDAQAVNHTRTAWAKVRAEPMAMPRTWIDELADARYAQMVADRLARVRMNGATQQLLDDSSFVDWTATPPDPEFWIDGLIPLGEQVVLFGRPEAGKTFTALDWAMSIASGRPWFDRPVRHGRVWFMAGEGNTRITSRIHAWIEHHQHKPSSDRLKLINHVPDLMSDPVIENLARRVAQDEVDVVFIDTLGRAMAAGGGDISAPVDAAQALKSLKAISKYRASCTPIAIHHPVKDGGMAGAYNLLAGVDVAIEAEVSGGTGNLRFYKNKDGEKTRITKYRWHSVGKSAVLLPIDGSAPPVVPSEDESPFGMAGYDERRWREEEGY